MVLVCGFEVFLFQTVFRKEPVGEMAFMGVRNRVLCVEIVLFNIRRIMVD